MVAEVGLAPKTNSCHLHRLQMQPLLKSCVRIASLSALVILSGCSAPHLEIADRAKAGATYTEGAAKLESRGKNGVEVVVTTLPNKIPSGQPGCVIVSVVNFSRTPFNFDTDNITISHAGKPLRIFTYEQLRQKEETRATMLAVASGLNAAGQSMRANTPTTTYGSGNYYGSTQSSYGSGYRPVSYSGSYYGSSTTYNPAQAAAANAAIDANTSAQMSDIAATRDANIDSLSNVIRKTTVKPGNFYSGLAMFKIPYPGSSLKEIEVVVETLGEKHVFPLVLKP